MLQILIEMKTTTVALGAHFDEFIQACVLGGRYTNASEVIRAGLRRLEEDEQKIAALRAAIEEGEKGNNGSISVDRILHERMD